MINVPTDANTIAGSCVDMKQYIGLQWPSKSLNKSNSLTMTFLQNNATKFYTLSNISADLAADELPGYVMGMYSYLRIAGL